MHLNVLHLDRTLLRILSYDAGLTIAIDINTVSKTQSNNKGISVHVIKLLRHTSSSLYVLFIHLGKLYHQQPRQSVVETRTKQEHLQTLLRNGVSTTTIYQTTSKPHRTFHCSIPRIQTNESHVWEGLWKVWELPNVQSNANNLILYPVRHSYPWHRHVTGTSLFGRLRLALCARHWTVVLVGYSIITRHIGKSLWCITNMLGMTWLMLILGPVIIKRHRGRSYSWWCTI